MLGDLDPGPSNAVPGGNGDQKPFRIKCENRHAIGSSRDVLTRDRPAWFVMQLAIPLTQSPAAKTLNGTVVAFGQIATTLALLARGGIAHQNITPEHLFWLDGAARSVILEWWITPHAR